MPILALTVNSFLIVFDRILAFGDSVDDRSCVFVGEELGWRCSSGECIPVNWVCDSNQQCPHPDDSDESIGCNLFPGNGDH